MLPGLDAIPELFDMVKRITPYFVRKTGDENIGGVKDFSTSPTVPTPAVGDNSQKAASTAYVDRAASSRIQTIGSSVAGNAATLTYAGGRLDFQNASLTSGVPVQGVVPAGSLVVPSTATLGMTANISARLILLIAYNSGSPVLCVANLAGGLQLDETNLISPTTISTGATSAGVIYSASAVGANSPYRVVGFLDFSLVTPGTWNADATVKRGVGGLSLSSLNSAGYANSVSVVGSRALSTTYYNTKGRPLELTVGFTSNGASGSGCSIVSGGVTKGTFANNSGASFTSQLCSLVPPGQSYSVTQNGGAGLNLWTEG